MNVAKRIKSALRNASLMREKAMLEGRTTPADGYAIEIGSLRSDLASILQELDRASIQPPTRVILDLTPKEHARLVKLAERCGRFARRTYTVQEQLRRMILSANVGEWPGDWNHPAKKT